MDIKQMIKDIEAYVDVQSKYHPMNQHWYFYKFQEELEEIKSKLEYIEYWEPSDEEMNPSEPPISAEERGRMALESKRESHGRGNPFHW
jgi:hypothetical protein